jgi:hypothetical protein
LLNLGKEKTPQATNNTKSKEIVVEAPQVVKRTPTKETMSSNVANKEPQAFKGKEKVTHNSSGGTPRRKLVIHGPVDDRQLNMKWKKLPIVSKESLESDMIDFDDGYDSKPLSNEMEKTSKKAQLDGGKDQAKKKEHTIVLPIKRVQTRASSGKN